MHPLARQDNLVIEEMWDEVVVYDRADNQVHRLNASAAAVWRHCDGTRSLADLAAILQAQLGLPLDETLVRLALDDLSHANLLVEPLPVMAEESISRRQMLERLAGAAYAIPLVASVLAVPAAEAASGILDNPLSPTTGNTIFPVAGVYGPVPCSLQGGNCNFFNSSYTGICTFNASLTTCEIRESGGSTRASTGSVSNGVGTFTGSGLVGSTSGTWSVTSTWSSNTTTTWTEAITVSGCTGTYRSASSCLSGATCTG